MILEARKVHVSRKDRKVLEACCRSPVTLQRDLKRARIVLLAAAGRSTRSIAKEVGVQPRIVSLWRHRYAELGLEGLQDKPRPGKQPIYTKATDQQILKLLDKPPPAGFARWSGPLLAGELGDVDVQYVWRFLRSHKIDLAARKSWCESNDPHFAAKAADVVGLYVAPPEKAIVLCVDEKPSIQALERAQGCSEWIVALTSRFTVSRPPRFSASRTAQLRAGPHSSSGTSLPAYRPARCSQGS
jgi:transposase